MKKALYILFVMFVAEAAFIAGRVTLPARPASASAVIVTRRRASKNEDAIMRKVLPVEYTRLMNDRNFHEDIARYYAWILEEIGYF